MDMTAWPVWVLVALALVWYFFRRFADKLTDRAIDRLLTRRRETVTLWSSPSDVPSDVHWVNLIEIEETGCSAPGGGPTTCGSTGTHSA